MANNTDVSDEAIAKVREHREDLEDVAETDLPIAWAAEVLLDLLDEDEGEDENTGTDSECGGRTE